MSPIRCIFRGPALNVSTSVCPPVLCTMLFFYFIFCWAWFLGVVCVVCQMAVMDEMSAVWQEVDHPSGAMLEEFFDVQVSRSARQ